MAPSDPSRSLPTPSDPFRTLPSPSLIPSAQLSAVDATCTRLATFPVPPSYHRHGSRAMILWLCSLPLVLEGLGCSSAATLLSMACTTFLFLGIDQIAIEIEQPLDVLPLHAFAHGMCRALTQCLESWTAMPPLPEPGDDDSMLGLPLGDASIVGPEPMDEVIDSEPSDELLWRRRLGGREARGSNGGG